MSQEDDLKAAEAAFAGGYNDEPTERPVVEAAPASAEDKPQDAPTPEADEQKEDVQPAAQPDPVAKAIADLTARMEKFQQSHDTVAGKLGRVQQGFEQLQANLAAAKAATGQVADAPGQADIKRAAADPAEWAALKTEFPEWGAAVEGLLDARIPKLDVQAFEQMVNERIEGKAKAMQGQIIDASLNAVFPGWKKDVASDEFKNWFEAQPDDIKATRLSDDVGDVARTLSLYAKHKEATAKAASEAQAAAEKATAGKKDPSAREKRLAAAVTPKGTGGHAPGRTELDEFEAGYTG